jgi:hypothetical protein
VAILIIQRFSENSAISLYVETKKQEEDHKKRAPFWRTLFFISTSSNRDGFVSACRLLAI